jgi:predicted HicB family RNase H-like nuclease
MNNDDPLDREIDFAQGVRGKFYRPGMELHIPVYLEQKVMATLTEVAERKGVGLNDLVNDLLRRELDIAETLR